jgi:hypothetical protein
MSNWYTDKKCKICGGIIATNGKEEWCERCIIIKGIESGAIEFDDSPNPDDFKGLEKYIE